MLYKAIRFLSVFVLIGCAYSIPPARTISISPDKFYAQFPDATGQGILISCIRCGCFNQVMNAFIELESKKYNNLYVAADTVCGKFSSAQYVSQNSLDNVSEDFYNIILFKVEKGKVLCRIVKTDESKRINRICRSFFK